MRIGSHLALLCGQPRAQGSLSSSLLEGGRERSLGTRGTMSIVPLLTSSIFTGNFRSRKKLECKLVLLVRSFHIFLSRYRFLLVSVNDFVRVLLAEGQVSFKNYLPGKD